MSFINENGPHWRSSNMLSTSHCRNLTSNYISQLDPESFAGNFTKLSRLDLTNNHLTNILEGALDNLPALKYLDISANPLACDCELLW